MNAGDFRMVLALTAVLVSLSLAGLVTMHQRHYSQRRLILLEGRVGTIEKLLTEDRTL